MRGLSAQCRLLAEDVVQGRSPSCRPHHVTPRLQPLETGFFNVAVSLGFIQVVASTRDPFLFIGNNVPLHGYTAYVSTHRSTPVFDSSWGKCYCEHSLTGFGVAVCFHFSWVYADEWNCWFSIVRHCQAVFQTGCVILQSPQQCVRVSVFSLLLQYSLLADRNM